LEEPFSPRGKYRWGGYTWNFDFGRITPLLGMRPDTELARAISCSRHTLRNFRRGLKVPAYHVLRGFEKQIGKFADTDVAKRAGCSAKTVGDYRKRHKIPRVPRGAMHADRKLQAYIDDLERFFKH
jgi:hypothetical protein